jgi:hexosaminidase
LGIISTLINERMISKTPLLAIIIIVLSFGQTVRGNVPVIPKPESVIIKSGNLDLPKNFTFSVSDQSLVPVIKTFSQQIKELATPGISKGRANVRLIIENNAEFGEEGYQLVISRKEISVRAKEANGIFYALQTLRQMILFGHHENGDVRIPCCEIKDSPRFSWRGFMVDESRHFFGKKKIEQLLDIMALHKLNTFHWHLTDDPGWRIEIKKYPDLTLIGAKGNYHDPKAPAAFYTQEDIKDIVKYASARFIKIIPEIDMPGHAAAANRAYPEFCGGGSAKSPDFTFNPGKNETYGYLSDILREISAIIPTAYLHTGGDEVHFGNEQWPTKPEVQKLMKNENLKNLKEVESYFNKRMADSIKSLQKTLIGWDEIVDAGMDPERSVVMWWRQEKPGQLIKALEKNYKIVLCPRLPLYFDFVQDTSHQWGRKWHGEICTEENVYNFPPDTLPGMKKNIKQILGIQANLWSEVIQNNDRFDFMTYPRICALSEAAWTQPSRKDYKDFIPRLGMMLTYFDKLTIHYYNPFNPEKSPEPKGVSKP